MAFSMADFRQAMGRFATGITVITTLNGENFHAITVNAFASLSLEPPLVLICIDKKAESHDLISQNQVFSVNILSETQQEISDRYAGRYPEKRDIFDAPYRIGNNGCPIFEDSLAWAECQLTNAYDGGDHTIYIGLVQDLGYQEILGENNQEIGPLLYYRSKYDHFPA